MSVQDNIQKHIETMGHSIIGVDAEEDEPPFAYTIGLTETYDHPEILVFCLDADSAKIILNNVISEIEDGEVLSDGMYLSRMANLPIAFKAIPFDAAKEFACQAVYRYEDSPFTPQFLQLVLPDQEGKFPWDRDYSEEMREMQPELWSVTRH
ncbi:DUF4262 domain-containing protein [Parachitinimonas caeni]|uniref:DUF4262 domain-containing protein n=1 Tax=Parachitinimonas caeni TaxID=3031301 RepID=A0ABT7E3F6_9NEIS|nr:DUF4262 domain-containing protein [Parachitinimonas caeni]MDK2126841.1 DUF4262 domain-containing protein [Parachitinimonas caeni]